MLSKEKSRGEPCFFILPQGGAVGCGYYSKIIWTSAYTCGWCPRLFPESCRFFWRI